MHAMPFKLAKIQSLKGRNSKRRIGLGRLGFANKPKSLFGTPFIFAPRASIRSAS